MLPHLDSAYNLARWLAGNDQDAEDLVQEACLRALTFFGGFHGEDGRAWLLAIVRNTCYDWLRKNRRHAEMAGTPEDLDTATDTGPSSEAEQLRRADHQLVRESLDALLADYREWLVLGDLEEIAYKQLAGVPDLPIGTVMSRLARGRKR